MKSSRARVVYLQGSMSPLSGPRAARSSRAALRASSKLVLVYVARVRFGCSRGYEGMSKVFHFDIAKEDLVLRMLFSNVADVECCGCYS
jgi:hypothetical protein